MIIKAKRFIGALCLVAASAVQADTIPPNVAEVVRIFKTSGASLEGGILRVILKNPVVRSDVFGAFIGYGGGMCFGLYKKGGWGNAKIDRIELVNDIGAQGYAWTPAKKLCDELRQTTDVTNKQFIKDHAWVCVAGNPCRPRRSGELTSGDD